MPDFIPFDLPDIGEEEAAEVLDTLRSGWLTTGAKAKRFEEDFAAFIGQGAKAIAVNSATAGLHLALEAIGIGPGDQVITTPFTFTATAEVIRYLGADPVFVDIDPETLNIDPTWIEAAITPHTKAIIPVHYAGLGCDMSPILEIARKHRLKVVEDAAHALPTTYHGALIGTLPTDVTVYSFYANKTMTTGEGGMIVTRDAAIAERCRTMRLHGINRDVFDRYTSKKPSWYYEVVAPGFKYNLTDLAAAIGIHQLKKVWGFQKKRQALAEVYNRELQGLPLLLPPQPQDPDVHSWYLYVIRLAGAKVSRDDFIAKMAEAGIGCSVHFIPLNLHPYWRERYHLKPGDFPNAVAAYENLVSIPMYSKLSENDQQKVLESIRKILYG